MFEQLKKLSMKCIFKYFGILSGIIVIILLVFGKGFVKLFEGPKDIKSLSSKELPNSYVTGDIHYILDPFAEEVNDDNTTTDIYYVIPVSEKEFIGLHIDEDNFDLAKKISDETLEYIQGNISDTKSTLSVTGTVNKLEDEYLEYYNDYFKGAGFTQEEIDSTVIPYVLEVDYIGSFPKYYSYILITVVLILIIGMLIVFAKGIFGAYLSPIKKFMKQNDISEDKLEEEYLKAIPIDTVSVGETHTFYFHNYQAEIVKNEDLVWIYREEYSRRVYGIKIYTRNSLIMYTYNKKKLTCTMRSKYDIDSAIAKLCEVKPNIVTGYSDELLKCFNKDFETFLTIPNKMQNESAVTNEE